MVVEERPVIFVPEVGNPKNLLSDAMETDVSDDAETLTPLPYQVILRLCHDSMTVISDTGNVNKKTINNDRRSDTDEEVESESYLISKQRPSHRTFFPKQDDKLQQPRGKLYK